MRAVRVLGVVATLAAGLGVIGATPSSADVSGVDGSAFGYASDNISIFGGAQDDVGPEPTVTLAADASNSPVSATRTSGSIAYGPATLFSSGAVAVSTQGSLGPAGSVTSAARIDSVNTSGTEPLTATQLSSTCSASESGVTASTTVTSGIVRTDSGLDLNDDTDFTDPGEHPPTTTAVATNPAPNTVVDGHTHVSPSSTETFRYTFNEQSVGADAALSVTGAHLQLLGPSLTGDVLLARARCAVASSTTPPPSTRVVLLAGTSAPPTSDRPIVTRLEGLGHDVVVVDDDAFTTSSLAGADLLVVASSVVPSKVPTWLASSTVPILNGEAYAQTRLRLATSGSEAAARTTLRIVDPGHALAGGLSGDVAVQSTAPIANGAPVASAAVIARLPGTTSASVYGIETGGALTSGTAAARRVGFFFSYDSPPRSTTAGWTLFDAAVGWLLGGSSTAPPARDAVLLAGSTVPPPKDVALVHRLEQFGFDVEVVDDDAFTLGSIAGADVLVISSSVAPAKVPLTLADAAIPIVNGEAYAQTRLRTASSAREVASTTTLRIVNAGHPLAGGRSGDVVVQSAVALAEGVPAAGADVVARVPGSTRAAVYGIDEGAALTTGTAPARRVSLFLSYDSPPVLTANGWSLFDAAVAWATA